MTEKFRKAVSILLCLLLLGGVLPLAMLSASAGNEPFQTGDIIEFGWYPRTDVTEEMGGVLSELVPADTTGWDSYGYYSGKGAAADGQMKPSAYMKYTDFQYDGNKYRGVYFTSYRPYQTGGAGTSGTYQDDNGYGTGTVYWFKYEPLRWRVLDSETGMVMCDTIIDSQAFNNYIVSGGKDEYGNTAYRGDSAKTYYACNYAKSSIRQWLNNDFYNTAFSPAQQDIISFTGLENKAYSPSFSAFDSETTKDKIYLLTYEDALNGEYGFRESANAYDSARQLKGSDYAKSQGLSVSDGCSNWRLRSAGNESDFVCRVFSGGNLGNNGYTNYTSYGICPVFNFNPGAEVFQSDVSATGTGNGSGARDVFTVSFDANGHGTAPDAQKILEGEKVQKPADLTADGYEFGGWYKEEACENAWDFVTGTVTEATTLYAKWTERYTVTFDANGHGTAPDAQKILKGEKVQKPADLTADGYTFGGWYKEEACENAWDFDTGTVTEATTLYAKWTEIYTVTFDANGHGTAPDAQKILKGEKVQKPADLTADGYTFGGWYKEEACENAWDFDTGTVTESITLHARWTENEKPVTYTLPVFEEKSAGYKTDVTVSFALPNLPEGAEVYIDDGKVDASGGRYEKHLGQLTSDKPVRVEVKKDGRTLDSKNAKVTVDGGFFARIISFFSNFLFNGFRWKSDTISF